LGQTVMLTCWVMRSRRAARREICVKPPHASVH